MIKEHTQYIHTCLPNHDILLDDFFPPLVLMADLTSAVKSQQIAVSYGLLTAEASRTRELRRRRIYLPSVSLSSHICNISHQLFPQIAT